MDTLSEQWREQPGVGLRVDDLVIDIRRHCVSRDGEEIPLAGLSFELLLALARAAPNVLTYDELMDRVWPAQVINLETVTQRVKLVREALGDDSRSPRYILGIRGRGYRMIAPVTPAPETTRVVSALTSEQTAELPTAVVPKQRWLTSPRIAAVVAMAVLCVVAIGLALKLRSPTLASSPDQAAPGSIVVQPPRTIAVLPFNNFSGDAESEYFGDGLTEELLSELAHVPGLQVAARTSAFHFKDRNDTAQTIGRALGVRYLLEGSVRKFGSRVRVTSQLIDATTGYQQWSQTFDREITDILAIQDEIALAVVDGLNVALVEEARAALLRPETQNVQAMDLYLRARYLAQEWRLPDLNQAISLYERAIDLDPSFAAAYLGLAYALYAKGEFGVSQENPARPRIRALLSEALKLNPRSGDAHALLSVVLLQTFDMADAERELRVAESLNPNGEHVLYALAAFNSAAGWPPDKGIEYAQQWARLDPLNPWANTFVAIAYWSANRPERALAEVDKVIAANPDYWVAHFVRTPALIDLGRYQEALASAQRVLRLNPEWGFATSDVATTYALAGDVEQARKYMRVFEQRQPASWCARAGIAMALKDPDGAITALENAYTARDPLLIETLHYRRFLPLHGEPRFQRLVMLLGQERRVEYVRRMNPGLAVRE